MRKHHLRDRSQFLNTESSKGKVERMKVMGRRNHTGEYAAAVMTEQESEAGPWILTKDFFHTVLDRNLVSIKEDKVLNKRLVQGP